jgi:hypothetical protein
MTWRVAAASVQGVSHLKTGKPCQDAHLWRVLENGVLLAAVADGAGSAAFSALGAQVATTAALDKLQRQFATALPTDEAAWRESFTAALQTAREAVEQAAQAIAQTPRELACTLIIVAVTAELAAAVQVGDGAAVIGVSDGAIVALTKPQSGEYINETTFLVSADYLSATQFAFWQGHAQHVAVFSDGLQMLALKLPAGEPHAPFFAPLFRFIENAEKDAPEQLAAFLRSPRITARADDDLTLLLAARSDLSFQPAEPKEER